MSTSLHPVVSIIIPTKDRCELLRETLDSIRAQTCDNWEVIVVDDGSVDGSQQLVEALATQDDRFRFVARQSDRTGANICRNQGARLAHGPLLMFLDSDDTLMTDSIRVRSEWMARNQDFDFAVFHAEAFVTSPGDLKRPASFHSLDGDLDRFLYFDLPWLVTGPIWRREAFQNLGGFNEEIPSWQDVELHVRAIVTGLRYKNLPVTDYNVRWQNDPTKTSLQQRRSEHQLRCGERTVDAFEQLLVQHSQLTWTRLRGIACLRLLLAEMWINLQRWSDARDAWKPVHKSSAGSLALYYGGLAFLLSKRLGLAKIWLVDRLFHYWRGLVRLRNQPRLVSIAPTRSATG